MASELLPCPFCGGEAGIKQTFPFAHPPGLGEKYTWFPSCLGECVGNIRDPAYLFRDEAKAIAVWNRRAEATAREPADPEFNTNPDR